MRIVVTGASGLLGRAVVHQLRADGHNVVGTALSRATPESKLEKVDLTDMVALDAFLRRADPAVIVHTAAERRPDVVEREPEASQMLNVEVPRRIAAWAKGRAGPDATNAAAAAAPLVINISTDYVFDGVNPPFTVDDEPNPLNAYGKSKWEGEKATRAAGVEGRVSSLRVPVLYGRTETDDESAVNVLLGAIIPPSEGQVPKPKKMDANAVRYPTSVADVAKALSQLCSKYAAQGSIPKTLHFSAMEAMTKYDMCLVMARCLRSLGEQAEIDHLVPEYEIDPTAATSRPRHCKLDLGVIKSLDVDVECERFESWWSDYLKEYAERARIERERRAAEAAAAEKERQRAQEEEKKRLEGQERLRRQEQQQREAEERQRRQEEEEAKRRKEKEVEIERQRHAKEQREADQHEKSLAGAAEASQVDNDRIDTSATDLSSPNDPQERQPGTSRSNAVSGNSTSGSAAAEESTTATGNVAAAPTSSAGPASLRSPSSPNPSFSSLQARPTPPATSGRNSPSPSVASAGFGMPIPGASGAGEETDVQTSAEAGALATSMSTTVPESETAPGGGDAIDPLGPAALRAQQETRQNAMQAEAVSRRALATDGEGFFPKALTRTGNGASLGIAAGTSGTGKINLSVSTDADSDIYGQPSPRDDARPASGIPPFAAGYGEVPYGLQDSGADAEGPAKAQDTNGADTQAGQRASNLSVTAKGVAKSHPTFQIRVGDPQKVGDPVTAHIVYTVRIKTDSPHFTTKSFSVLRRYSDFRWLHAALVHGNPGIFVPPVPEKVKIGRFAPDLVEARRHGLESCINKIANNPALQDDDDLRLFLSSEHFHVDVKIREQIKGPVPTPEQKTYFGWSTSLTGQSHRYHEADAWFDEQNVYLDHLELQLKTLVRVVSALAQQRKEIAIATSDLSHALMMLSGSSLSRSLSTCFAGLGEVERRAFELADLQADADVRDFGSVVYEYERMVGSARKAFSTRIDAWQSWQRLEDEARKVRSRTDKLKREAQQGGHRASDGRLQAALEELAGIDSRCLQTKTEFDLISRRCKEEMDKFEKERIEAFHEACEVWLQGMIERSHEIMAEWEQYAALLQRQTGYSVLDAPPVNAPPPPPPALSSTGVPQDATKMKGTAPIEAPPVVSSADVSTHANGNSNRPGSSTPPPPTDPGDQ